MTKPHTYWNVSALNSAGKVVNKAFNGSLAEKDAKEYSAKVKKNGLNMAVYLERVERWEL